MNVRRKDVMSKDILASTNQVGQPDEEMPELQKQDFIKAKPNRFIKECSSWIKIYPHIIKRPRKSMMP